MRYLIASVIIAVSGCLASGSIAEGIKWNFADGDQRVTGEFVKNLVLGKKLRYDKAGTEHYNSDGSYMFTYQKEKWIPKGYEFFEDGMRCLDYRNGLRCDMYVVNSKKLVMINSQGYRYVAKITK